MTGAYTYFGEYKLYLITAASSGGGKIVRNLAARERIIVCFIEENFFI